MQCVDLAATAVHLMQMTLNAIKYSARTLAAITQMHTHTHTLKWVIIGCVVASWRPQHGGHADEFFVRSWLAGIVVSA